MENKEVILIIKYNIFNFYSIYDVVLVLFYIKVQYLVFDLIIKRCYSIILLVINVRMRVYMGKVC